MNNDELVAAAWALDFSRAILDRPLIIRLLFRLIIGKYAMREFYGLIEKFRKIGYVMQPGWYGLEYCEYQKKAVPFRWWDDQ